MTVGAGATASADPTTAAVDPDADPSWAEGAEGAPWSASAMSDASPSTQPTDAGQLAGPAAESEAADPAVLLEVEDLVKDFPIHSSFARRVTGKVQAVSGVSFYVRKGETLGLVGESGCGKSTTQGRMVLRLIEPTSAGSARRHRCARRWCLRASGAALADADRFQDPYASLDPAQDRRLDVGRAAQGARHVERRGQGAHRRVRAHGRPEARAQRSGCTATSSPEVSDSASASRGRSSSSRTCSCSTNRCRRLDVSIQAGVVNLLEETPGPAGSRVRVHRTRPVCGASHLRPGRGDVSRQDRRDRHPARDLRHSMSSVHTGAALRRSTA